jgi:uncharacterized membrane protein YeaQ/YmgE (transglycosylase-associated protein family)
MFQQVLGSFFQDSTLIGIAVALIGGWLLKKWPAFDNRFIPIATFVVSVITQFINFFQAHAHGVTPIVPIDSTAVHAAITGFGPTVQAGFFDGGFFKSIIAAILQWVLTSKVYDTQKQAIDGAAEVAHGVPISKSQV